MGKYFNILDEYKELLNDLNYWDYCNTDAWLKNWEDWKTYPNTFSYLDCLTINCPTSAWLERMLTPEAKKNVQMTHIYRKARE